MGIAALWALAAIVVVGSASPASSDMTTSGASFSPLPPQNPFLATGHGATMHGDGASSKVVAFAGPGPRLDQAVHKMQHACPTILLGSDNMLVALCTHITTRNPRAFLLNPANGDTLAEFSLERGNLLSGVYGYLDNANRLVLIDSKNHNMLRLAHEKTGGNNWRFAVVESVKLDSVVPKDDAVVALMPDAVTGHVWLATDGGLAVTVAPNSGALSAVRLSDGPNGLAERIANSISVSAEGMLVTTTHALYLLRHSGGRPEIVWRQAYDRSTARKPGQLSWGSGATPVLFGPKNGTELVVITDNARPHMQVIVRRVATGDLVCRIPVFTDRRASGSENAAIAAGSSIFLSDTYGYPYPAYPEGAGESQPKNAPFVGGLTRVDVREDGSGCDIIWTSRTRSAALPKLSSAERMLYTVEQIGDDLVRKYATVRVDADNGMVTGSAEFGGALQDPLQTSGTLSPDGVFWQGSITSIHRVAAKK